MKTICFKESTISAYLCDDAEFVNINEENIIIGDPVRFIVLDMNSFNATLHEKIQAPNDWKGLKYFFDGSTWSLNSDYLKPPIALPAE